VNADELISNVERDVGLNRRLCLYFLHRLAGALRYLGASSEPGEEIPSWIPLLFGGKEGLAGAYIRLSQQQLRIAAVQMEAVAAAGKARSCTEQPLAAEDIAHIRALLMQIDGEAAMKEEEKDNVL